MELGAAVAIFIVIAIFVMALFCLTTRYFNYKLEKALKGDDVLSMIDDFKDNSDQDVDPEVDDFLARRGAEKAQKNPTKGREDSYMVEMSNLKTPLSAEPQQIYGMSMLRKRLNGEMAPAKDSGRSFGSKRSFRLPTLNSSRSMLSQDGEISQKQNLKNVTHTYISRLVGYNRQGLTILEVNLSSINVPPNGTVTEVKTIEKRIIKQSEPNFMDDLEAEGLENGHYAGCKYETTVFIPESVSNTVTLNPKNLQKSESKVNISLGDFAKIKSQLLQNATEN